MESALRGIRKFNVDVGVFQGKKIMYGIYNRGSAGHKVVTTLAPIRNCSGVALFYHNSLTFAVKAIRQFGANIIAGQMEIGERRWYIVGCYLSPGNVTTI